MGRRGERQYVVVDEVAQAEEIDVGAQRSDVELPRQLHAIDGVEAVEVGLDHDVDSVGTWPWTDLATRTPPTARA